jgi:hypothetical protein
LFCDPSRSLLWHAERLVLVPIVVGAIATRATSAA